MEYKITYQGWAIFKTQSGSYEAYKSRDVQEVMKDGRKVAKDITRCLLSATTLDGAMDELASKKRKRVKKKAYDPYSDPAQTRIQ